MNYKMHNVGAAERKRRTSTPGSLQASKMGLCGVGLDQLGVLDLVGVLLL